MTVIKEIAWKLSLFLVDSDESRFHHQLHHLPSTTRCQVMSSCIQSAVLALVILAPNEQTPSETLDVGAQFCELYFERNRFAALLTTLQLTCVSPI